MATRIEFRVTFRNRITGSEWTETKPAGSVMWSDVGRWAERRAIHESLDLPTSVVVVRIELDPKVYDG